MIESKTYTTSEIPITLPDSNGCSGSYPSLLTEDELMRFLRMRKISKIHNYPASLTTNHQPVFDPPRDAGQDQHSYTPCWLDLTKSAPITSG